MNQDLYTVFNTAFSTAFILLPSVYFPGHMRWALKCFEFHSALSHPTEFPCHSKSIWRTLTSMKEEKTENISGALHGKNVGICDFFSLQNSQRSRLLQECSLQPGLRWKSFAFSCQCTLSNNINTPRLPRHTSPRNDYWKRKHASLHTASTLGKKHQTWKLQHTWGTNEVATALAPPTDFTQWTATHGHTGVGQGCGSTSLLWDLQIPYTWGSGSRRGFKANSLSGRVESLLMPHSQHCHKLHKAIIRSS